MCEKESKSNNTEWVTFPDGTFAQELIGLSNFLNLNKKERKLLEVYLGIYAMSKELERGLSANSKQNIVQRQIYYDFFRDYINPTIEWIFSTFKFGDKTTSPTQSLRDSYENIKKQIHSGSEVRHAELGKNPFETATHGMTYTGENVGFLAQMVDYAIMNDERRKKLKNAVISINAGQATPELTNNQGASNFLQRVLHFPSINYTQPTEYLLSQIGSSTFFTLLTPTSQNMSSVAPL